ncbi:hypothetical protein LTR85_012194 [Meristemomyces frigidus]|nr:hypothetical protein LTR85_012194 [Meristemomyces frigidus]
MDPTLYTASSVTATPVDEYVQALSSPPLPPKVPETGERPYGQQTQPADDGLLHHRSPSLPGDEPISGSADGQTKPSAAVQKVLDAAQRTVFYTIHQKVDETKPKKCVLDVATMQAVTVRAWQDQVIRAGVIMRAGKLPTDLSELLHQYCNAVRDMDYMQEKARSGFDRDPFLLMTSKQSEREMMEGHGLMRGVEQLEYLHLAPDSEKPVLPGVGRTARILAAQSQSRKLNVVSALAGGLALIVPMIIMRLIPGKVCSLVTTSSFVACFAVAIALLSDLRPNEILGVTAAYAAVLVVFVGTTS